MFLTVCVEDASAGDDPRHSGSLDALEIVIPRLVKDVLQTLESLMSDVQFSGEAIAHLRVYEHQYVLL